MTRLGVTLGAQRDTFMGLAGLGDLVLTCTDDQSRNRRFGLLLASGKTPEQALADIGQAVEGYPAAKAVRLVAQRASVDMPICDGHLLGAVREAAREGPGARAHEPADQGRERLAEALKSPAPAMRRETVLAPRLVDHERYRVREVETAVRRTHRDGQVLARAAHGPARRARGRDAPGRR